ncbi:MAG: ATP-binding cassette domain-containing protein [Gemmatimonadetes bacterium]|nr:ABC transporter ATP-binding protein [Gemmatimonadota bacterium]NIQ60261.1 ABC transporter ATP-binding protein [Gemmatimonadota bacterium]NIU80477.1 ATP-binding cassette domain-containing protein [Gammaproteobacteria bacterium]NIX48810.1 ATP-binding cassette domain-containing protein [Gemmatimonadota bacterium]NIY13267.1 ATP-binding cassette domain-containing protein [Gemmatimonadota bacterium]
MELRIDDVSKTYPGGVRALRGVTLTIPTGMFGLLGPNGAGKSTLMRTIATLQQPDTGTVRLGELDVRERPEEVRKLLGYLPQDFGVYPKVTAEEMLDHLAVLKGLTSKGERKDAVEALLRQTNLWDARKRKLGGFSGGMRQRFGIAQALIGSPRLVIVDEPTAGLDPAERMRFLNLLAEIGENIVVILSTHIVEDVSDLCRRMAILDEGRLLFDGEPRTALAALQGRVWQRTIDRSDLPREQGRRQVISTHLAEGRTVVHVKSEDRPGPEYDPVEPDLKDVYFTTLGDARATASASAA